MPWSSVHSCPGMGQSPSLCLALILLSSSRLSVSQVTSHVGPVEVSCSAGARWGIRGEPCALHHPGSRVWGSGRGLGVLGTPCKASTCTGSGCSAGRGAEPCLHCSPLCLPHARLRGLPVPQVNRLETLLKFGLWLFGVPWANSECCPHPVPVPRLPWGCPPLTALLSPQSGSRLASPCPPCTASAHSTPGSRCRRWVLPPSPHPAAPLVPHVPPHLTPTPRRASCSSPRTCSTSRKTSHCVGTCRPPTSRVPVPHPAGSQGGADATAAPWPAQLPGRGTH